MFFALVIYVHDTYFFTFSADKLPFMAKIHFQKFFCPSFPYFHVVSFHDKHSNSCGNRCFHVFETKTNGIYYFNFLLICFLLIVLIREVNYLKLISFFFGIWNVAKPSLYKKCFSHDHIFLNNCFLCWQNVIAFSAFWETKVSAERIVKAVACSMTII